MTGSTHRRELLWASLIAAVAVFGPLYEPPRDEPGSDTWSARPGGKKVFFTLARRLLGDVRRTTGRLVPPDDASTLWLLGPPRHPDAEEWKRLHTWVSAGHTLVFAARRDDPAVTMGPFGLRVRAGRGLPGPLTLASDLFTEPLPPISWKNDGWIDGAAADAWIPVRSGERAVVVSQAVGAGRVVAVASDELFENAWLVGRHRGRLSLRLVEATRQPGPAYVSESLSESGPPRIFGLLLSPAVRPVTLQLLVVFLVVGWRGARMFGSPLPPARPPRRAITEHAAAAGRLHEWAGTGGTLVASYLEEVRHDLGLGRGQAGDPGEAVSRRTGVPVDRVRAAFARARRGAGAPGLPRREAAEIIRSLAEIRSRITRRDLR